MSENTFESLWSLSRTENGDLTYNTSGSNLIDCVFHIPAKRDQLGSALYIFSKAYTADPKNASVILMYLRDCRGGAGEKRFFKQAFKLLSENHQLTLLDYVPFYGSYKDLIDIFNETTISSVRHKIASMFATGIDDKNHYALKYAPRQKSKLKAYIMQELGLSNKGYRKKVAKVVTTETLLSAKKHEDIDFSKVPSIAHKRYMKAFNKTYNYSSYMKRVKRGSSKINTSQVDISDLYNECLKESSKGSNQVMWDNINVSSNISKMIVMLDTSGSMGDAWNPKEAAYIANPLAVLLSEKATHFAKNHIITFSTDPRFVKLEGTVYDKQSTIDKNNIVDSTNLRKAVKLLFSRARKMNISQENMPTHILILSDMEFDRGGVSVNTTHEDNQKLSEEYGYRIPTFIYWNVESRANTTPARSDEKNAVLIGGRSHKVLGLLEEASKTPEEFLHSILSNSRYNQLYNVL